MAINQQGVFVPVNDTFDFNTLQNIDINGPEFKTFITRLNNRINQICTVLNQKDTGNYILTEYLNSQTFFPDPALTSLTSTQPTPRSVFRKVINFGALPNAGTKSVAHGITISNSTTLTRLYASASDTTGHTYIPIPFVNVAGTVSAGFTELSMDATNVKITTTGNGTNYNICYVIIEWLQS